MNCRLCIVNNLLINLNTEDSIQSVIKEFHDNPLGGHEGLERTVKRIEERYFWNTLKQDVKSYIINVSSARKTKF